MPALAGPGVDRLLLPAGCNTAAPPGTKTGNAIRYPAPAQGSIDRSLCPTGFRAVACSDSSRPLPPRTRRRRVTVRDPVAIVVDSQVVSRIGPPIAKSAGKAADRDAASADSHQRHHQMSLSVASATTKGARNGAC
jgi:hypothetical protein